MKTIKNIATRILGFPVEETGFFPLLGFSVLVISLTIIMRLIYA